MLLGEAIEDYLLYLQHEQNASGETIRSYRPSLRRFLSWIEANGHPFASIQDITTPLARRYLYSLSEAGLRPRSRLRLWIPVRSMSNAPGLKPFHWSFPAGAAPPLDRQNG